MKTQIFFIAVYLLILIPSAQATVIINCVDQGSLSGEITYDATDESSMVRGFSLDITVSSGVILGAEFSGDNWIDPGFIVIGEDSGLDPEGLGTSTIILEMASLYEDPADAPPWTGSLCFLYVSQECDVTITENALRGGVILEDMTEADIYAPTGHITPEPATIFMLGFGALALLRKKRC
ncbi:MAG: PEP-CTERM sorting domain-containing protein [Planctomycetota bacterium]